MLDKENEGFKQAGDVPKDELLLMLLLMMMTTISTRKIDDGNTDTDNITLGPQCKLLVLDLPVIVTAIKVLLLLLPRSIKLWNTVHIMSSIGRIT